MIIKEEFNLIKSSNILSIPSSKLRKITIPDGSRKIASILKLSERRINHFAKDNILQFLLDLEKRKSLHLIYYPDYILPVSYNKPTKSILLNLSVFATDDISSVDSRNVYAITFYGILFSKLVSRSYVLPPSLSSPIINFLLAVLIRLFGKSYGLLGMYSDQISKLKFLLSFYILESFFGIGRTTNLKQSSSISSFDYRSISEDLKKYDFRNIEDFIKSLSDFGVMPGIDKYSFTSKILRYLSLNFITAFEDVSRFVSVLSTSNIGGNSLVPSFIYTYNENEFDKILQIAKLIFK